jgi:HK97 family phage portal protein
MSYSSRALGYLTTGKYVHNAGLSGVEELSTVYTCFRLLSQSVGQMKFQLKDEEGNRFKDMFGMWKLIATRPNAWQTWYDLFVQAEYHRSKFGNTFFRPKWNGRGQVQSIELIVPSDMYNWKKIGDEIYYYFQITEPSTGMMIEDVMLTSSEIIHVRAIAENGVIGLSPLAAIALNMSVFSKALQTTDKYYENGALGVQVLETVELPKGASTGKNLKEETEEMRKNYFGFQNTGSIIPLPPGTKVSNVSNSFKDADMIQMLFFNKKEIASTLGIPMFLLGEQETASNSIQQLGTAYLQNTVNPILKLYADAFNVFFLQANDLIKGRLFHFDTSDFVLEDLETKSVAIKNLVSNGVMTPRQGAAKLNMQVEGNSPYLDYHYMQGQFVPLEEGALGMLAKTGKTKPVKDETTPVKKEKPEKKTDE